MEFRGFFDDNRLPALGERLRARRKRQFPEDTLQAFALRIGVSRATLQKMESGDLSVGMGKYYAAAQVLGCANDFQALFASGESLFDD